MKLTWFGAAGFKIESDKHTLLIDPYFTRNKKAFPRQALKPSKFNLDIFEKHL